ncbi:MAG: PAS domain S-box protein [Candidatus Kryptoniota bacterium]
MNKGIFRSNQLTSKSISLHLKDYLENRADDLRALSGKLAAEKSLSNKIRDIDNYYSYGKIRHVAAVLLFSKDGSVIYSTDSIHLGRSFSGTRFWEYVLTELKPFDISRAVYTTQYRPYSGLPFAGTADTSTNVVLMGNPLFIETKPGEVQFIGAVAILVQQHWVIEPPTEAIFDSGGVKQKISVGLYTQTGFPLIHLWSNVAEWNRQDEKIFQRTGRAKCILCHEQNEIDTILGETSQVESASLKRDSTNSETGEFLWTSFRLVSRDIFLQDSVWYVVMSADRGPIRASVNSYMKGSLILTSGAIIFLVIMVSLSFYGFRKKSLEKEQIKHLEQVANIREQYESLIENSNDGIYIILDREFVYVNKKFRELLGYTLDELAGVDFLQLVAPESKSMIEERVGKVQRGEKLESRYGFIALSQDGKKIPVEVSVTHVPFDGKVRTIGIFRDLSELTAQKQLYEELFNNAPIGLGIYKDFKAVRANAMASKLLGYDDPAELVGSDLLRFVHPDDLPMVKERLMKAVVGRVASLPVEEHFVKKDGSSIHVLVLSQLVIYEGEEAIQLAFVSLEDRKKLEENLAREAARNEEEKIMLDTLLQSLDEGIIFQDPNEKFEFVNAEFCRIFGFENPWQVIGNFSEDILVEAARKTKHPEEFIERVLNDVSHRANVKAHRLEFADGTIVERSALPLYDWANKYIGRLSIFRDITIRERNEESIKRLQRSELLGRLAGGIAHDFNNVLGVIIASLEMILRKPDNTIMVQDDTRRALASAIRGTEVAKRLLQFVRYSPEGFKTFSLREIVEETVSIIKHTFVENILVHTAFVIRDAAINGSPGDIQQVIINLANNSRDAMPDGGTITVSLAIADKAEIENKIGSESTRQYALLKIQDTGQGIGADKLEKVFDPFFTTKDVGKGTGLGLSIVQTIISAHNGFIKVKSQPGKGTIFFIYVPIVEEKSQKVSASNETEKVGDIPRAVTILVVEDEAALRELLTEYLSDKGFNVVAASNGEEGLELFESHPEISIVLSDLGLPKFGGDKLIARAKEIRPDVKCILATGYLTPAADEHLSSIDVRMIDKPYNLVAVYNVLIELLSGKT